MSVNCYIWQDGCNLDWSITAAWAQAIISGAAIWWASKVALTQVALQFKNDKLMREVESLQAQITLINALFHQIDNIKGAVNSFFTLAKKTQSTGIPIAKHDANNYMHVFQDALEDIQKISIYGLKNEVIIYLYMALRLDIRQLQFNCNLILNSNKVYSPSDFSEFESAWKQGVASFEHLTAEVKLELEKLTKLQNTY